MPYLVIRNGASRESCVEIRGDRATLGRDRNCTIQILDHGVSRVHAELLAIGDLYILRDLSSTNGTYVRRQRIQEEVLRDGDDILIGTTRIFFLTQLRQDLTSNGEAPPVEVPEFSDLNIPPGQEPLETEKNRFDRLSSDLDRIFAEAGNEAVPRSVEAITHALDSELGCVARLDEEAPRPLIEHLVARDPSTAGARVSTSVLRHALRVRRPVLCSDAIGDERFTYSETILLRRIRSLIAVPVVWGRCRRSVLYFTAPEGRSFNEDDLELAVLGILKLSLRLEEGTERVGSGIGRREGIERLLQWLATFHPDAHSHVARVADYCQAIAMHLGLDGRQVIQARQAGLLHDIGKLCEHRMYKESLPPLEDHDRRDVRHVKAGEKIISLLERESPLLPGVRFHHEYWDGSGFPYGAVGEEIPVVARIVTAADLFDRLTGGPPGSVPRAKLKQSLRDFESHAEVHLDPRVGRAVISCHKKFTLYKVPEIPIEA